MSKQLELPLTTDGEAEGKQRSEQPSSARNETARPTTSSILELAMARENMFRALKRVRKNGGSPGSDGMTVDELPDWLKQHWRRTREELFAGTYQPQPIRRATIPKRGGGERQLGIPTVLDRLIQQALLQVLQPLLDPSFSEHSHGFRPGRSARDAVCEAREYAQAGKKWVVDVDLEKFFDRVNHDILMNRLGKRIEDRRTLRIVRQYLTAGVMVDGVATKRHQGTPQGGPLSPLLANVLLDDIDQELDRRGHAFVRYADDLRVFVSSKRAGQRVMNSLKVQLERLKLRVNESKSTVDRVWKRPFLGFAFWVGSGRRVQVRIANKALIAMKHRVRTITGRSRGRSLNRIVADLRTYLVGWKGYFQLANTPKVFRRLDMWIRRRLRAYQLKQWKRGKTVFRELRALGASVENAADVARYTRSWWRNSAKAVHIALPKQYFDRLGVPRLAS